jgi:hypothetical protein
MPVWTGLFDPSIIQRLLEEKKKREAAEKKPAEKKPEEAPATTSPEVSTTTTPAKTSGLGQVLANINIDDFKKAIEEAQKVAELLYPQSPYEPLPKPTSVKLGELINRLATPVKRESLLRTIGENVGRFAATIPLAFLYNFMTQRGQPDVQNWEMMEAERKRTWEEAQKERQAGVATTFANQLLRLEQERQEAERELGPTIAKVISNEYSQRVRAAVDRIGDETLRRFAQDESQATIPVQPPIVITAQDISESVTAKPGVDVESIARQGLVAFAGKLQRIYGARVNIVGGGESISIEQIPLLRSVSDVEREETTEETTTGTTSRETLIEQALADVFGGRTSERKTEGRRIVRGREIALIEPISNTVVRRIRIEESERERKTEAQATVKDPASKWVRSWLPVLFPGMDSRTAEGLTTSAAGVADKPPDEYIKDPLGIIRWPGRNIVEALRKQSPQILHSPAIVDPKTWRSVRDFTEVAAGIVGQARGVLSPTDIGTRVAQVALGRVGMGMELPEVDFLRMWPEIQQRALSLLQNPSQNREQAYRELYELFWGTIGNTFVRHLYGTRSRRR